MTVASVTNPPPDGPYVGTTKSAARPVVAILELLRTVIMHETISLTRAKVPDALVCPTQESMDEKEGTPSTMSENGLLTIRADPSANRSVIKKLEVATFGAVTKKLNVKPPFAVMNEGEPLPDGP